MSRTLLAALTCFATGCATVPAAALPLLLAQERAPEELPAPKTVEPRRPALPVGTGGAPLSGVALTLERVLVSVDRHYPLVLAAEQERVVADGRALAARGVFDLNLTATQYLQAGSYPSSRTGFGMAQAAPALGTSFFAGYRNNPGEFPVYYGERKTADGGEFRAGMLLPLLRDRDIDRRRAAVAAADIDRALVEPNIHLTRVDVTRAATRAYWAWVAAAQRFQIASEVVTLARTRDAQLARRVEAGNLAPIERVDNERTVREREARQVSAARVYQAAAIALALYLRDEAGVPQFPDPTCVPPFAEPAAPPPPPQRSADVELAARQRPELARLALQREKLLVELRAAENQTLPGVNLSLTGAQDVGAGKKDLDRATYEAALLVDVPLQRTEARGRILTARGALGQILEQERMARDRVQAEILDALSALERAWDLRQKARANLALARRVEQGEVTQFDAGKSDLFRVNLRELMRAEAQVLEVDALAEYYRARADYEAALGNDPSAATRGK